MSNREPVLIVEIKQPRCTHTYGQAPCTASGPAELKCYNTAFTCQDAANFQLGPTVSLFFSRGNVSDRQVPGLGYCIPSLVSVNIEPLEINLAGGNTDQSPLGVRGLYQMRFNDNPHTDQIVDPYLSDRNWDPLSPDRGSFWLRWMRRNKIRDNMEVVIYKGYAGQTLAEMTQYTCFIQKVDRANNGSVTITAKDILTQVLGRKRQIPPASPGKLKRLLRPEQVQIVVEGAVEADYPASGELRIGDELMSYTARTARVVNTIPEVVFTGVTRGIARTAKVEHEQGTTVQQIVSFVDQPINEVLRIALEDFGKIDPAFFDLTGWQSERDEYRSFYNMTGRIFEPTDLDKFLPRFLQQAMINIWWDDRTRKIRMKAIRGVTGTVPLLTSETNIIRGSFQRMERTKDRISQTWVYWRPMDGIIDPEEPEDYREVTIYDLSNPATFKEPSVRIIYADLIPSSPAAFSIATRMTTRHNLPPETVTFDLDAKDRSIWLGDDVQISHHELIDDYGARDVRTFTIISAHEIEPGHRVRYVAEDTAAAGRVYRIQANGSPDYPGAATADPEAAYIGDNDGLLSDGNPSARIT